MLRVRGTSYELFSCGRAHDEACAAQSGALSRAEAEEQLTALAGEAVVKGLQSAGWKERLTAMEALQEHLSAMPAAELAAAASAVIQVRGALRSQQMRTARSRPCRPASGFP